MATIPSPTDQKPPLQIGMLLYPGFTLLDLAGPQCALGIHGRTHLFAKTLDPVMSDTGIALMPTATFDESTPALDILFVPGGPGTVAAMADRETIDFLADRGRDAGYITSVCSGSLILAMAGLLDGYRAATHWGAYEALEALGIEAGRERVVADRNRFTGGGVTAGIDFGLTLLAEVRGADVARMTQLMMEYDPAPPFDTGHPDKAAPELVAAARALLSGTNAATIELARARQTRPLPTV